MDPQLYGPLIKIGTEVVTGAGERLVDRVSDALRGLAQPWQIKRVAKAEAEAIKIRTKGEIECRAMLRAEAEELRNQANIESIVRKAIPHLQQDAEPSELELDWTANFLEKCRTTSREEMQDLWARILAGQSNSPGAFSRHTVNLVSSLDHSDANLFSDLCRFNCEFGLAEKEITPVIYLYTDKVFEPYGIHFDSLRHLDSLGLIRYNGQGHGLTSKEFPEVLTVSYLHHTRFSLRICEADRCPGFDTGIVLLTRSGLELASICDDRPVPEFVEYLRERWKDQVVSVDPIIPGRE